MTVLSLSLIRLTDLDDSIPSLQNRPVLFIGYHIDDAMNVSSTVGASQEPSGMSP